MLTFFKRKNFLVDHLEGFIDIHNHILPGIDDGAKTVENSIDLIKGFEEFGVKNFICTPHIIHNYHDNTPKTIKKSFNILDKVLNENYIEDVKIKYAAEHMIDDNFENILSENKILPLNKDHLLIEMSYLQPSINFNSSIEKIKSSGFFPVFAHPERYQYLNSNIKNYSRYKSLGLKFQLNLLSIGGYYGKEVKKTALKLLESNEYEFLGSDVHNMNHIHAIKSIKIKKQYSKELYRLKENNWQFFQ